MKVGELQSRGKRKKQIDVQLKLDVKVSLDKLTL